MDLPIRRALLSVWDKTGIVDLAQDLVARGVGILSTGGTLEALRSAGLPVQAVSDFTGHPEIFDGRVKTLHPRLEGAILFRRDDHGAEAERLSIPPIDLVVVNLYPFLAVTADPSCDLARALEHIDIGGPTMIRAAAKNHPWVAVVTEPAQYGELRLELQEHGAIRQETRARWAREAFATTATYDAAITSWLGRDEDPFPPRWVAAASKVQALRYGENPHQRAAFYGETGWRGPSLAQARQLHGKELSYNNLLDADAALGCVLEFPGAAAVIVKHGNPSGVGERPTLLSAYDAALASDPVSAFGGILAVNRPLDLALAERIGGHFFEVIVAPAFEPEARSALERKAALRLLALKGMDAPWSGGLAARRLLGGWLVADWDVGGPESRRVVTQRGPDASELASLEFAWRVAKHTKSNAIVLARDGATLGVGAGQMSRVDSSELAVRKARRAGLDTKGAVLASDAFFPFRDGLDAAIEAGCTAVIQPGGSKRDEEVIAAADEAGLAMVFTDTRHFRH
jgi:phosphoribosylaminoimidazolecarboxamide formyltransferase/IMP cyclohydrolase